MFRFATTAALVSLWLAAPGVAGQGEVSSGGFCNSDIDCAGGLDCARMGMLASKRCMPVSCAQGAGQAILDYGFDPEGYIATIMTKTGLENRADFMNIDGDALTNAIRSTKPPMEVFNANYTACVNPEGASERRLQTTDGTEGSDFEKEVLNGGWTAYGVQWSGAALLSYFGRSTWWDRTESGGTFSGGDQEWNLQLVSNCIGVLLGADVGVDLLIQTVDNWENWEESDYEESGVEGAQEGFRYNPGDMVYTPIFTAGPIGVQMGWDQVGGTGKGIMTEVTLGASFGAALTGFSQCNNELTLLTDVEQESAASVNASAP